MHFSQTSSRDWQPGCLFKPVPTVPNNWNLWLSGVLKYDLTTVPLRPEASQPGLSWTSSQCDIFLSNGHQEACFGKKQALSFIVWYHIFHTVPRVIYSFCLFSLTPPSRVAYYNCTHRFLMTSGDLHSAVRTCTALSISLPLYSGYSNKKR